MSGVTGREGTDRNQAFCASVLPHAAGALALARSLTAGTADAEDITQEALLRAWKYFDGFQGASGLPWLEAIVRNTYRSWRSRSVDESGVAGRSPRLIGSEQQVIRRLGLRTAVARLPAESRSVFLYREVAGFSYAEIADRLGIPVRAVYERLNRARVELRKILRDYR